MPQPTVLAPTAPGDGGDATELAPAPHEVAERFAASVADLDLDPAQRAAALEICATDRRGLYLWGSVGRGKSMLAERYLAAAGVEPALRLHLNELFRRLQAEIVRDWQAPAVVLRRLLGETRALLVDEFHVHDVADAVYLTALLRVAEEDGILVVATSNYAPGDLLPDPQHHARFLPAIARIEEAFAVVEVGPGPDHRAEGAETRHRFASGSWRIVSDEPRGSDAAVLEADGIPVSAVAVSGDTATFTFAQLCDAEVGVRQFQWLADRFAALRLESVPDLATVRREPLMRFTTLVDVLYDHDVRLDVTASAPFERLQDAQTVPVDAARALSRLRALRLSTRTAPRAPLRAGVCETAHAGPPKLILAKEHE